MLFVKSLIRALLLVALCLSPLCLRAHWGGCERGFEKDIYQLAFPKKHKAREIEQNRWRAERKEGPARPYHWHRCVCFLQGCMVNVEWFPRCRVPANEAVSYSLLGVMGAGKTPATWQRRETGRSREWKVASHDIPKHGNNQMPSINNSF